MRHARGWVVLGLLLAAVSILVATLARRPDSTPDRIGSIATTDSLQLAGRTLEERGDYAAARDLYRRVLEIRRAQLGSRHPDVAASLLDFGIACTQLAVFDTARVCLQEALSIRESLSGSDHLDVAPVASALGQLFYWSGDYAQSRHAYDRALAIREAHRGPDHKEVAGTLNNLATLLIATGDDREAQAMLERALTIRTKALGPRHRQVASTIVNLALIHRDRGEMEIAGRYYRQALEIVESSLPPQHPLLATYLLSYGRFALDSGDDVTAAACLERAEGLRARAMGDRSWMTAVVRADLALIRERAGDTRAAVAMLDSALVSLRRALDPDHPDLTATWVQRAHLLERAGDSVGALASALEGERGARAHLQLTAQSLSEKEALQYDAVRASGLDAALGIAVRSNAAGEVSQVWDALVRSRALVLDELAARQHLMAASSVDARMAERFAALRHARARVAALKIHAPVETDPAVARTLLVAAQRDCDAAERGFASTSARFRIEMERRRVGFEEVRTQLPAGTALLAYVVYGSNRNLRATGGRDVSRGRGEATYAALVLGPGGGPARIVLLGTAATVEPLTVEWLHAMRRGASARDLAAQRAAEVECLETGSRLRARVWDPVVEELAGAERIVVVPDGVLSLVNFYALPQADGRFLVEHNVIVQEFAAERDLVQSQEVKSTNRGLLALGGPQFDADASGTEVRTAGIGTPEAGKRGTPADCGDLSDAYFAPLPAAAREAEEVAALWSQGVSHADNVLCLTGPRASEAAFAAAAPGRRVLHIATHGFFLNGACPDEISGTRGFGRVVQGKTLSPPRRSMLGLAGLALAGANASDTSGDPGNDGILTAEEISSLDLRGVEVAVLSACDTGLGEIRAREGVLGLRRAFTVAGASTLILGLWAVRDDLAREWMLHFHNRYLAENASPELAARDACREVLQARRARGEGGHPFAWAGFITTGGVRQ